MIFGSLVSAALTQGCGTGPFGSTPLSRSSKSFSPSATDTTVDALIWRCKAVCQFKGLEVSHQAIEGSARFGNELEGRVALVTGSAGGIGAAVVEALVKHGAFVIAGDIAMDEGRKRVEHLGGSVAFVGLDVTSESHWKNAVRVAETKFGSLGILVNNAGIIKRSSMEETSLADFQQVLNVNLIGQFLGIRAVIPSMRKAGGGSIVNVSSVAGLVGSMQRGAYSASKWGIRGLTKTAALELAVDGIRVNVVHPGMIRTEMTVHTSPLAMANQPIARMGSPEEIAQLVLFLASDSSSYSTGSEFIVDGGQTAGLLRNSISPLRGE
jgi:3alpha(or 20beta)-hydroxysteroid dehydrogenase